MAKAADAQKQALRSRETAYTRSLPQDGVSHLPPSQIVPHLADKGEYMVSESSFYRVLHAAGEQHHRGRAQPPRQPQESSTHCASRKVVGWEVYERESSEYASHVVRRTVLAEGCINLLSVLHADNGSPMKGATLRATLDTLGVSPSFSRPGVGNDNPFSESIFRTYKYRPEFPERGFESLDEARE